MNFFNRILITYQYIYYRSYLNYLKTEGTNPNMAGFSVAYSLPMTILLSLAGLNKLISSYSNIPQFTDYFIANIITSLILLALCFYFFIKSDFETLEKKFGKGRNNTLKWKLRGVLVVSYYLVFILLSSYFIFG